ncbi:MAG: GNAT family N-acetyltransferase [Bdellovibrionales bacterium]|nr:GNAT family N-acetyltransferase [Bdellovibrionales bacterium]
MHNQKRANKDNAKTNSNRTLMLPETIHTDRLILRPYTDKDIDDIMEYAVDPNWSKFLPVPHPYARSHAVEFVKAQLSRDNHLTSGWAIQHNNKVVGGIDIRFNHENCRADIGYSIAPSLWGQGFATEAAHKIIDLTFKTFPTLRRIMATADAENIGSLRVMEKLGMKKEGLLRKHRITHGKEVDVVICSVLREEWD